MNTDLEIKLKTMAKGLINKRGDSLDLFNAFKQVFEMRADVQTKSH